MAIQAPAGQTSVQADATRMQVDEKGDVVVPVTVTDAAGTVTVECEMCWAWITRGPRG